MTVTAQVITSPNGPVRQLREIFREQIACAIRELGGNEHTPNVHNARKQLKKARATLRLLCPAIGDDTYLRENVAVRDAARPLSSVRDAEVMLATFDALLERAELSGPRFTRVRSALSAHLKHKSNSRAQAKEISAIRNALATGRRRATTWSIQSDSWDALLRGLAKTYKRGRRGRKAAQAESTTELLHDWRKQAKYLWHQLQVLTPVEPGALGELADQCHRLANYLGDEHDLAVLSDALRLLEEEARKDVLETLDSLIQERRSQLRAKAFALGDRLYADKTTRFTQRFEELLQTWRKSPMRPARQSAPSPSLH